VDATELLPRNDAVSPHPVDLAFSLQLGVRFEGNLVEIEVVPVEEALRLL
jgi:hypothetical protein